MNSMRVYADSGDQCILLYFWCVSIYVYCVSLYQLLKLWIWERVVCLSLHNCFTFHNKCIATH